MRAKRLEILDKGDCSNPYIKGKVFLIEELIEDELQEIDTLTVSRLRPMCDAKDFEDVLTYKKFGDRNLGFIVYRGDGGFYYCRENSEIVYKDDELLGHIPMPIYKPELTGDGE